MDPSLTGPPSQPAGPIPGPAPSTEAEPPDGAPRPVPPARPSNGNAMTNGTDPAELDLGGFRPLEGPKSSKIHDPGPAAEGMATVPAQHAGRGESPWALPPQRVSVGAEEPGRVEESGPVGHPVRAAERGGAEEVASGAAVPAHAASHAAAVPGRSPAEPTPSVEHPPAAGMTVVPPHPAPGASLPHQPTSPPPLPHRPGPAHAGPTATSQAGPGPAHPDPTGPGPAHPDPSGTSPPATGPVDPGSSRPGSTGTEGPVPPGQRSPGGWYRPSWPEQPAPGGTPTAAYPDPAALTGYPDLDWSPESGIAPTAEDFARRRQIRPADPVATMGVRAMVNKIGLVRLPPGQHEQEVKRDIEMVRRNFGGLRQVTVVNPKGGAGKTVAILLLAMTFGQKRGGYVLAWDNNETQGTLGMRAQQDFHSRTVRDMLRDLGQFQGPHGRIGDLSQYVRSQGEGMFDVLASDESATGGEMLTAAAFAEIREVVSRFYKLIFVDTGNNVRAQNWQAAMDATDQLVVTMSARNDSAETAARMLDHLEQSGRQRLVRQAVTVVSMPPSRKEIDLPAIQEHFAARTRAVLLAPYERLIDTGEPIRYGGLSSATRDAWLKIAAAVAEGL
ncbi:chromosome partitioning protein [Micromonospora sp. WMMD987]|uniref:MinD/ParA family ATP-binding protein n=1 Tax=Micromonospora sp. WMMD987 TaxID=3016089 RepID=UPI00249B652C|nr:chromosome partitioning protein [Micromonospora sp. WMMD987]WFE98014.1 chromosome partitioning protein [Micromonospora sp. WMMD987]